MDDQEFELELPHNLEAEQAVLGACLIDPGAWDLVKDDLTNKNFHEPKHQMVWRAMHRAAKNDEEGGAVDLITVTIELQKAGDFEKVGGTQYLADLADSVPSTANADHYAGLVLARYQEREFILTQRETAAAVQAGANVDEVIARQQNRLTEIAGSKRNKSMTPISDVVINAFDTLEARFGRAMEAGKEGAHAIIGTPSGYLDLDKMTSGFRKQDLIILAARPAVGKTAFALNVAQNVAIKARETVAIFSLEMGKEQLVERMMCAEGNIDAGRLRTGMLEEEDWPKLTMAVGTLSEAPIFIDDTPGVTVHDIRAKCKRLKAEQGGLGLILIDYLQLISGKRNGRGGENRQQEVSEISRTLKLIARELDVPVIALSQLSRSVEQRQDKRPMMSDLRESGSIEQDADIVSFLYRPDYYDPETEKKNIVEVIIAKQRSGPTGTVELVFLKNFNKFVNLERAPGA